MPSPLEATSKQNAKFDLLSILHGVFEGLIPITTFVYVHDLHKTITWSQMRVKRDIRIAEYLVGKELQKPVRTQLKIFLLSVKELRQLEWGAVQVPRRFEFVT